MHPVVNLTHYIECKLVNETLVHPFLSEVSHFHGEVDIFLNKLISCHSSCDIVLDHFVKVQQEVFRVREESVAVGLRPLAIDCGD